MSDSIDLKQFAVPVGTGRSPLADAKKTRSTTQKAQSAHDAQGDAREPTTPGAREAISRGEWVDCWLCRDVFRRQRPSLRYCSMCDRAFCEGEHGNFARGHGRCVICGARQRDLRAARGEAPDGQADDAGE